MNWNFWSFFWAGGILQFALYYDNVGWNRNEKDKQTDGKSCKKKVVVKKDPYFQVTL